MSTNETRLTLDQIEAMVHPNAARRAKYAPKLRHEDRCAMYGLFQLGYGASTIAEAYGVHLRTAMAIANKASPHYRSVRKEYADEGHAYFMEKYVTKEQIEKINRLPRLSALKEEDRPNPALRNTDGTRKPNPMAKAKAGKHAEFEVVWAEVEGKLGWYVVWETDEGPLVYYGFSNLPIDSIEWPDRVYEEKHPWLTSSDAYAWGMRHL